MQKQSSKLQQSDKCKQSCPELCKNQKVQTQVEILRDKCFHEITFKNIEVDLPENDVCGINYNDTHLALCVRACMCEREKERESEREREICTTYFYLHNFQLYWAGLGVLAGVHAVRSLTDSAYSAG